jgi:hypothetical protein
MCFDGELGGSLGFMINSDILRNSVGLLVRAKSFSTQIMEMSVALNYMCRGEVRNFCCASYQAPY